MPSFFFQVNKMRPHPQVPPRHTAGGIWVPPKLLGANIAVEGDTTSKFFFFNGTNTQYPVVNMPGGLAYYRTFSVYYDDSSDGFWLVDYNALQQQVGDGSQDVLSASQDESDEDEDEENWRMDWKQLSFVKGGGDYDHDYTSYVTCAGNSPRLFLQKDSQVWAKRMFPERYHAPPEYTIAANHPNQHPSWGGLIGDLPLIIALIAFSVRENEVAQALRLCLQGNPWKMHGTQRRRGCM